MATKTSTIATTVADALLLSLSLSSIGASPERAESAAASSASSTCPQRHAATRAGTRRPHAGHFQLKAGEGVDSAMAILPATEIPAYCYRRISAGASDLAAQLQIEPQPRRPAGPMLFVEGHLTAAIRRVRRRRRGRRGTPAEMHDFDVRREDDAASPRLDRRAEVHVFGVHEET